MIKYLFFLLFVKPFIYLVLGFNVRNHENLPTEGPCIIAANHNSHIDTLLLMSIFPFCLIKKIHPVAAYDYFFNTKIKRFIFKNFLDIIPIQRKVNKDNVANIFKGVFEALKNKDIIIIYPEGTRGEDNKIGKFKTGIAHIVKEFPEVPVVPVYINGPDKIMPKIDFLPVPFISDVYAGKKIYYNNETIKDFTEKIQQEVIKLKEEHTKKENL